MKYLILLMLLLLFSCTEKEIDQSALKLGKVHTHIWYHKSAPEYNLKGPVKEVRQKVYKIDGERDSYTIGDVDSVKSLQGTTLLTFNKAGLVTFTEMGQDIASFDHSRYIVSTNYSYSKQNVILRKRVEQKEFTIGRPNLPVKELDSKIRIENYFFNSDTLRTLTGVDAETPWALATLSLNDSQCIYANLDPYTEKYMSTNQYLKGRDGIFRMSAYKDGERIQFMSCTYKESKLLKQAISTFQDSVDLGTNTFTYNDQRDAIHLTIDNELIPQSYRNYEYIYRYDKHNNWIEKIHFLSDFALKATRREITYYK